MEIKIFPSFCFFVNHNKNNPVRDRKITNGKGKKNCENSFLKINITLYVGGIISTYFDYSLCIAEFTEILNIMTIPHIK